VAFDVVRVGVVMTNCPTRSLMSGVLYEGL